MKKWERVRVGDVAVMKRGKYVTRKGTRLGNIPVILGGQEPAYYCDESNHEGPCVVISRSGASAGFVSYWDEPIFVTDGFLFEANERCDIRFLYYCLKSNQSLLGGMQNGSGIPHVQGAALKQFPISLPPLSEQRKIANELFTIDRKIALNRKRIATLEAMAKEIYDYWFVQFDFPDAHGRPYKSSGGAMVYNPDLKREIPKGWEVKALGDIVEVVNGATPSTVNPRNYDGDVVWITPKDLSDQRSKFTYGGSRTISRDGYDSCSTHMLPKGSILMSSRAPIGLLSIAAVDLCTNQGFKSFVPKEIDDNLYLYYYLKEHMAQIEAMGSGTTFKEVSRESMISFQIPYVSERNVYASFVAIAKPIFNQQEMLGKELARLSVLRDFLLPLLMNGQVKVA